MTYIRGLRVDNLHKSTDNENITMTNQSTTKPCSYFMGCITIHYIHCTQAWHKSWDMYYFLECQDYASNNKFSNFCFVNQQSATLQNSSSSILILWWSESRKVRWDYSLYKENLLLNDMCNFQPLIMRCRVKNSARSRINIMDSFPVGRSTRLIGLYVYPIAWQPRASKTTNQASEFDQSFPLYSA